RLERAPRPLPHLSAPGQDARAIRAEGRRLLPLALARQPRRARAGERVRLIPAQVARGHARVAARGSGVRSYVALELPRPALLGPPLSAGVAAIVRELQPLLV